ncbi:MAG: chemotaxis protein CheW [Thermodesulfobacteriota bacterium]
MNRRGQPRRPTVESEEMAQMISFSIGSEQFGVSILAVQEIIMMSDITPIPNAPEFVEGVINLRGNIIPVLDLRKRLKIRGRPFVDAPKATTRILVVEIDENVTGFIVDGVSRVLTLPASKIMPPPDILVAGIQSQYISGVVHLDERIMVVLDFRRILTMDERDRLEQVARELPEDTEAVEM